MSSLETSDAEAAAVASAPRVSLSDLQRLIAYKEFSTGLEAIVGDATEVVPEPARTALGILTLCFLVTTTGFTIVGKSAPAHPENFDPALGRKLAYEDAIRQLWPLEGYALRKQLSEGS